MYCPQCGAVNNDTARFCGTCGLDLSRYKEQRHKDAAWAEARPNPPYGQSQGRAPGYEPPPYRQQYQGTYQTPPYSVGGGYTPGRYTLPRIPSYLGWAIAVLILCFWPTGIVAVVYASQVGNKLALGDITGARESSRKAMIWCWVSFGIAMAGIVITIIGWLLTIGVASTVY